MIILSEKKCPHPWVRLTKIAQTSDPLVPPASWDKFHLGQSDNGIVSLPIDYWLEGFLVAEPELKKTLKVARYIRNDVVIPGMFTSTVVVKIEEDLLYTLNSIYRIEYKNPPVGLDLGGAR
jgi:hypothetical protein